MKATFTATINIIALILTIAVSGLSVTGVFSLVMIILRTDMELTDPPLRTIAFVWWPFCLYSGWITVALLTNIAAVLGHDTTLQPTGPGRHSPPQLTVLTLQPAPLAIILTLVAGTVYLFMTWRRNSPNCLTINKL